MKCTRGIVTVSVVLLAVMPLRLVGHPHSWVTLSTELFLDKTGRLTELHEYWDFDIYYSTSTLAQFTMAAGELQTGLDKLATKMIENLKSYNYFSELKIENLPVVLTEPSDYSLKTVLKNDQKYLRLHIRFELVEPKYIEQKVLMLSVFDPTYYIDMSHSDVSGVVIHSQNGAECSKRIELPEPSYELIDYASSLDVTDKSSQGLGAKFAEQVFIKCL